LEPVESLGTGGAGFLEARENRDGLEGEAGLRDVVDRLNERPENQTGAAPRPVAARS